MRDWQVVKIAALWLMVDRMKMGLLWGDIGGMEVIKWSGDGWKGGVEVGMKVRVM